MAPCLETRRLSRISLGVIDQRSLSSCIRHPDRCTHQAICLPVCPTGAWLSTPPYKFDPSRCLESYRLCLDACPSQAIYGVFKKGEKLLEPQKKTG